MTAAEGPPASSDSPGPCRTLARGTAAAAARPAPLDASGTTTRARSRRQPADPWPRNRDRSHLRRRPDRTASELPVQHKKHAIKPCNVKNKERKSKRTIITQRGDGPDRSCTSGREPIEPNGRCERVGFAFFPRRRTFHVSFLTRSTLFPIRLFVSRSKSKTEKRIQFKSCGELPYRSGGTELSISG